MAYYNPLQCYLDEACTRMCYVIGNLKEKCAWWDGLIHIPHFITNKEHAENLNAHARAYFFFLPT